jgi:hypothetical protein
VAEVIYVEPGVFAGVFWRLPEPHRWFAAGAPALNEHAFPVQDCGCGAGIKCDLPDDRGMVAAGPALIRHALVHERLGPEKAMQFALELLAFE